VGDWSSDVCSSDLLCQGSACNVCALQYFPLLLWGNYIEKIPKSKPLILLESFNTYDFFHKLKPRHFGVGAKDFGLWGLLKELQD
jgi:hypothetical protein